MVMDEKIISQKFKYLFITELKQEDFALKQLNFEIDDSTNYSLNFTFDYLMDVDPEPDDIKKYLEKASDKIYSFCQKYQFDVKTKTFVENRPFLVSYPLIFGLDFEWGQKFLITMRVNVGSYE